MCIKSKPRAGKDKLTKKYIDGDGGFALCGAEQKGFLCWCAAPSKAVAYCPGDMTMLDV
jgi:hypothetical protein